MTHTILSLNAGSSSIKFAVFSLDEPGGDPAELCRGQADGLTSRPVFKAKTATGRILADGPLTVPDGQSPHEAALAAIVRVLETGNVAGGISAVGHRIVHGGSSYTDPVVLNRQTIAELERLAPLAPLHQSHNLGGVKAAGRLFPDALQVACFDTAFHRTHAWVDDTYALPRSWYEAGIRRYGFHGLSYAYVTAELARIDPASASGRVVVAHLGNGASMCAVRAGRAVATTMGFSPLDGLAMGTRTGQIDPSVVFFLAREHGLSLDQIEDLFYRRSGLKGLSGLSADMRELEAAGTPEAEDAISYFVHAIRRELGALTAILGGLDALVFCGGIGENAWRIRQRVCADMDWLGLKLDSRRNRSKSPRLISATASRVVIRVVQTDEESWIAKAAARLLKRQTPSRRPPTTTGARTA